MLPPFFFGIQILSMRLHGFTSARSIRTGPSELKVDPRRREFAETTLLIAAAHKRKPRGTLTMVTMLDLRRWG